MENKQDSRSKFDKLKLLRKSVYKQAILAVLVILLTVVLLFAMTTAWYTNVAQTSGLMFEVAQWGFNGTIDVSDEPIVAGPGDEGGVYMTLNNASDSVVDVSVYADKTGMNKNMQQRLFFYVETSEYINGEHVDRVYLTSGEGYDYTVFGKGNLTLTESYHNDAQIKWEWVYDVLGYYVTGTLQTTRTYSTLDGNVDAFKNGNVAVEEYIRPIEYDYDEAKTTFDENGKLQTIDGTTTVADFLSSVTSTDGYSGTVDDKTVQTSDGFYPVSVDPNTGYGVWLYLCNYSEIEQGIIFDTQQGNTAAANANESEGGEAIETSLHTVTLNITAQPSVLEPAVVSNTTALTTALETEGTSVIQLGSDVTLSNLNVPAGADVMLDLNGKTLTYDYSSTDTAMMTLSEGSSVTILNGTIASAANKETPNSVGFQVTGGELTLSGVTTLGIGQVVNVKDGSGTGTDSKVRLLGCTIDAEDIAIYMTGNGTASDDLSQLVVEGCTINAKFAGVYGNGSASAWGTDITVGNTTITGGYTGIYHPQKDSTLTIYSSTIESYTGVAIKGGYVSIIDSIITGTGGDGNAVTNITPSQSGFFDTGDGVYVETNYGWPIEVEIYNSTVSATGGGLAVRQYLVENSHASIVIYSGTFSSQVDSSHIFSGSTQTQDTSGYKVAVNTESTQ